MKGITRAALFGMTALAMLAGGAPAQAHNGSRQSYVDRAIEGEGYWTPDSGCDPTGDGEHTSAFPTFVFLPESGCGANYGPMYFSRAGVATGVYAHSYSAFGYQQTVQINLYIDGIPAGSTTIDSQDGWTFATMAPTFVITPGYHTARVEYVVLSGPYWSNLNLDFVALTAV